jgi:aryl-alcohol dehydrogenase-like predicted oxidoreductase
MFERFKMEQDLPAGFSEQWDGYHYWSPLAAGFLTGKYIDGIPEGSRLDIKKDSIG